MTKEFYTMTNKTRVFENSKYLGDIRYSYELEMWRFIPRTGPVTITGDTLAEVKARMNKEG